MNIMMKTIYRFFLPESNTVLVGILFFSLIIFFYSAVTITRIFAEQSNVQVKIYPTQAELKSGEDRFVKISFEGVNPISGFDLYLKSSGGIEIVDVYDQLVTDNKALNSQFRKAVEEISAKSARISYVFLESNEPASFDLFVKVRAGAAGQGELSIDTQASQILISGGEIVNPEGEDASYKLVATTSSEDFYNADELPGEIIATSAAVIRMKLKLLGIKSYPAGEVKNLNGTVVAIGRVGENNFESQIAPMILVPDVNGIFEAKAIIPEFKDGTKFSLMVKVNNYLLRRICDVQPTENNPNEYLCQDPELTIRQGENMFDFSAINLMPGDLASPDGILNSYDLSLVRNNLGKTDLDSIKSADLNLDGVVDKKDFDIITYSVLHTTGENDK